MGISAVSATFFLDFSGFWGWFGSCFGSCFGDFYCFSYFFLDFFRLLGLGLGAVLGISAVSATFFWIFFGFWVDFGSCFKSFMDYSSTRACLLCYQPMAIVHYANLVLLNKYTFLTEGRYARPGHLVSHTYRPSVKKVYYNIILRKTSSNLSPSRWPQAPFALLF